MPRWTVLSAPAVALIQGISEANVTSRVRMSGVVNSAGPPELGKTLPGAMASTFQYNFVFGGKCVSTIDVAAESSLAMIS